MLEFVAESGLSKAKGEAGRIVRSHVARVRPHGRARKRDALSKRAPPLLVPLPRRETWEENIPASCKSDWDEARGNDVRRNTPRLNISPGDNRVDPFDMLPIGGRGNPHYIITQCKLEEANKAP